MSLVANRCDARGAPLSWSLAITAGALSACGGGGADPAPPIVGPSRDARAAAARATAESTSNACAPIRPFYWEVGDAAAGLASGSVASLSSATRYTADTATAYGQARRKRPSPSCRAGSTRRVGAA